MSRTHHKPHLDMSRAHCHLEYSDSEQAAHVFSRSEVKLAGLSETRLTGNGELLLPDFSLIHSGDQHVRGVALLVHNSIRHSLQT